MGHSFVQTNGYFATPNGQVGHYCIADKINYIADKINYIVDKINCNAAVKTPILPFSCAIERDKPQGETAITFGLKPLCHLNRKSSQVYASGFQG